MTALRREAYELLGQMPEEILASLVETMRDACGAPPRKQGDGVFGTSLSEQIAEEIVDGSRAALGDKLLAVILYGSVARSDDEPDSDIDIALFVSSQLNQDEQQDLAELCSQIGLAHDTVLSAMDIIQRNFEEYKHVLPYYQNIHKEGIVLWKAV